MSRLRIAAVYASRLLLWLVPTAIILWMLLSIRLPDLRAAGDLVPVYWGAHSLLEHGDAYDFSRITAPEYGWEASRLRIGNVYPLPATLILGLPMQLLQPLQAAIAFVCLIWLLLAWLLWRSGSGPASLWWIPVLEAMRVFQLELVTLSAYLVLLIAHRESRWRWAAVAVALLSLKPQAGAAGLILTLWWFRGQLWRVCAPTVGIWVASLAIQPGWMMLWIERVHDRNELIGLGDTTEFAGLALLGAGIALLSWRYEAPDRDRLRMAGLIIAISLLVPWPQPAWYPGAAWLVALPRAASAVAVLPPLALWLFVPAPVALTAGAALGTASWVRDTRRATRWR